MLNKQLYIFENLANLSVYEEENAAILWEHLLNENKSTCLEAKNIRTLLAQTDRFADCTAVTQ